MEKKVPQGISVIYFNDNSKSIYAELPSDNEQAKRLSKRIYKSAMITLVCPEELQANYLQNFKFEVYKSTTNPIKFIDI